MNLRTFKKQMHRELQVLARSGRGGVCDPKRFDRATLWCLMIETNRGRHRLYPSGDPGRMLFWSNPWESPWGKHLKSLKPDLRTPRVLIAGTNFEVRSLMSQPPLAHTEIRAIAEKHGLAHARFDTTSKIGWFWSRFYGSDQFLYTGEPRDVPALIVTTGAMRNYSDCGGETLEVDARLREIGSQYRIPVEFIQPFFP